MRWGRFSIIILIATILDAGNLQNSIALGAANIKPDLLLILMVFSATNCTTFDAIIISFVIGFAADISSQAMGPAFISFGLFGSLISQLRKIIIMKKMTHQSAAIFTTALVAGGFTQILTFFKTGQTPANIYTVLFWTAVYSGILGPFVWSGLATISRWFGLQNYRLGRGPNR